MLVLRWTRRRLREILKQRPRCSQIITQNFAKACQAAQEVVLEETSKWHVRGGAH